MGRVGLGKAIGLDTISSKILRLSKDVIMGPTTFLVNRMITDGIFPASLKEARVSPVFKKKDPFDVQNYSIDVHNYSILPITSKIFERALEEELSEYFEKHFHPYLSASRNGFSCQSVLLAITEEWRNALDRNEYVHVAAILMDF